MFWHAYCFIIRLRSNIAGFNETFALPAKNCQCRRGAKNSKCYSGRKPEFEPGHKPKIW